MPPQQSNLAPNLRERRRRELTRVIANAAVELFERDGVAATTVDDIAAAAGISRRTFFRYCEAKEAAVLVDDAGLEPELIAVAASASAAHPLQDLEDAWDAMTAVFDADPEGHDRFLRVRRLMNHNPSLLAAGLQRDASLSERIAAALHEQAGLAELDARAVAGGFAVALKLTFDEWVHRVDEGLDDVTLRSVYRAVREALARAARRDSAATNTFGKDYWESHWQGAAGSGGGRGSPPNPYLESDLDGLTPGTALDAGCGEGAEAIWLATRGWHVTAADISAEALSRAAAQAGPAAGRVEWVEADLSVWQPSERFDLVTTFYAHPAMPQLAFYERIADWVAPGGTLLIVGHLHAQGHDNDHGHHPPAEASVNAATVREVLDPDRWHVVTAEERDRTLGDQAGRPVSLRDVVVRAERRPDYLELPSSVRPQGASRRPRTRDDSHRHGTRTYPLTLLGSLS